MNRVDSYFYSKISSKGDEFEFMIDNHHIKIKAEEGLNEEKRLIEERVFVFVDNDLFTTLRNDEADVKDTIELFNHKVFIHYRVRSKSNVVWDILKDTLLLVNEGLFITVDGKPLKDSIADPATRIKIASFGYYILAGLTLITIFSYAGHFTILIAIAAVAITCGLLTKKLPLLFLPLGVILGTLELIGVFVSMSRSSFKVPSGAGVLVLLSFILIRVGIILNFILGIIAVIKIRTLRTLRER